MFDFFYDTDSNSNYSSLISARGNKRTGGTSSPLTILTNLSLRVEIPSRLGHHLISWRSTKSNHTSIKLAQSMFPNDCDRWPPWYLGFEIIRREIGENRLAAVELVPPVLLIPPVGYILVHDTNTICILMHSYGRTDLFVCVCAYVCVCWKMCGPVHCFILQA